MDGLICGINFLENHISKLCIDLLFKMKWISVEGLYENMNLPIKPKNILLESAFGSNIYK